jgi:hypothetical protein
MSEKPLFNPTPLKAIHDMVKSYKATMQDIADLQVRSSVANPSIVAKNQYLQFYIDKAAFLRLQKFFDQPDCDCLGVFFGIDKINHSKLTASFLGLNSKKEIIDAHFGKKLDASGNLITAPILLGEENWPPPPENGSTTLDGLRPFFTVASDDTEIASYFGQ